MRDHVQLWRMRSRRMLVCIPVLAYLACTLFGLHSHVGLEQVHPDAPHQSHHGYVAAELSSDHLSEHLTDDDVDVEVRIGGVMTGFAAGAAGTYRVAVADDEPVAVSLVMLVGAVVSGLVADV